MAALTNSFSGPQLGVAFACRLAERASEHYVSGLFVAGFFGELGLSDYDPINSSFFESGLDWVKAKDNLPHVHCYAGDNDPYVPCLLYTSPSPRD